MERDMGEQKGHTGPLGLRLSTALVMSSFCGHSAVSHPLQRVGGLSPCPMSPANTPLKPFVLFSYLLAEIVRVQDGMAADAHIYLKSL